MSRSLISKSSRRDLLKLYKKMKPIERLKAFVNHSYLMNRLAEAGRNRGKGTD